MKTAAQTTKASGVKKSSSTAVGSGLLKHGIHLAGQSPPLVQAKLRLGRPNDRFEREADQVAERVMQMPQPESSGSHPNQGAAGKVTQDGAGELRRRPEDEPEAPMVLEDEDFQDVGKGIVRRKTASPTSHTAGISDPVLAARIMAPAAGQPLPNDIRTFMEPRFGADFSAVRIHTMDADRADAQRLNARAFTYGQHIWMGHGASVTDMRLMAHELSHVVQQKPSVQTKQNELANRDHYRQTVSTISPRVQRLFGLSKEDLNKYALELPGYRLLTVILGKNPITEEGVVRNGRNFIRGVLGLIPGGNLMFEKIKKLSGLNKILSWFRTQDDKYKVTLRIKTFLEIIGIELEAPSKESMDRIETHYSSIVQKTLVKFAKAAMGKIFELTTRGLMKAMGRLDPTWKETFRKAGKAVFTIIENPKAFITNLIKAIKDGFLKFINNIFDNLKKGLLSWLFGAFSNADIELPKKWDAAGLVYIVFQLLKKRVFSLLTKIVGEKKADRIAKIYQGILKVITGGGKAVAKIVDSLYSTVFDAIRNWMAFEVLKSVLKRLAASLSPVGLIAQGALAIYNAIRFLIDKARELFNLFKTAFESLNNIIKGNTKPASDKIEETMKRSIPLIIDFGARQVGLGNIGEKIRKVMMKVTKKVDSSIKSLARKVLKRGKRVARAGKKKVKRGVEKIKQWWLRKIPFTIAGKERHEIFFKGKGAKASLTVSSPSQEDYDDFLKSVGTAITRSSLSDDDKENLRKELAKAKDIYAEIKNLMKRKPKDEVTKNIHLKLNQIGKKTKYIAERLNNKKPSSTPVYGDTTGEGGGRSATVLFLSSNHPKGSKPHDRAAIWKQAQRRNRGNSIVYVQGHLLNHNLGGMGRATNLTPLTGTGSKDFGIEKNANKQHQNDVEDAVKKAVDTDKKVARYTVKIAYNGHKKRPATRGLETVVNQMVPGDRKERVKSDIKLRRYEERHFPTQLTYSANELKASKRNPRLSTPIEWKTGKKIGKGKDSIGLKLPGYNTGLPLKDVVDEHLVTGVSGITTTTPDKTKEHAPTRASERDLVKIKKILKDFGPR